MSRSAADGAIRAFVMVVVAGALACGGARPPAEPAPRAAAARPAVEHVVVISVDGLLPAVYTEPDAHGLAVPTLRRLAAEGASSPGARSVMPSLTYPSHTTIATGVDPGRHGIVSNKTLD